eukprot:14798529-Ditylum_brightwellii.AAC.1
MSNQQEKKGTKTTEAKKETVEENQRESHPSTLSKLDITGGKHQSKKQQTTLINRDGGEKAEEEANKKGKKMKKGEEVNSEDEKKAEKKKASEWDILAMNKSNALLIQIRQMYDDYSMEYNFLE